MSSYQPPYQPRPLHLPGESSESKIGYLRPVKWLVTAFWFYILAYVAFNGVGAARDHLPGHRFIEGLMGSLRDHWPDLS